MGGSGNKTSDISATSLGKQLFISYELELPYRMKIHGIRGK